MESGRQLLQLPQPRLHARAHLDLPEQLSCGAGTPHPGPPPVRGLMFSEPLTVISTCKVVFTVSMGMMNILQAADTREAAAVWKAIGRPGNSEIKVWKQLEDLSPPRELGRPRSPLCLQTFYGESNYRPVIVNSNEEVYCNLEQLL